MALAGAFHSFRRTYFVKRTGVDVDCEDYDKMIRGGKMVDLTTYHNDYLNSHAFTNFIHHIAKMLDAHAKGPGTKVATPKCLVEVIGRVLNRFACNIKNQETGKKYVANKLFTELPNIIRNKSFLYHAQELMREMEIFNKKDS